MKTTTSNNQINNQEMNYTSTRKMEAIGKIGGTVFHLFIYIAAMMLISAACSAQCDGVSLACNNDINISTDNTCQAMICLDHVMEGDVDFELFEYNMTVQIDGKDVDVTYNEATGCITVGDDFVDKTLEVSIHLLPCGLSCWGYVNIEDKIGPSFVGCSDGFLPSKTIDCEEFFDLEFDTPPLAGDCAATITPEFKDDVIQESCEGDIARIVKRTWVATDSKGNSNSCCQEIEVRKFELSDVVFPDDFILELEPAINCDLIPSTHPDSIEVYSPGNGYPTGHNCPNIMYTYNDIVASQCGVQIKILRDWVVVDWCTGDVVTDGQVIKILDVNGPIVSCRPDMDPADVDTIFFPAVKDCAAQIVLDPFGLTENSNKPLVLEDCSGVILDQVAYRPAVPGTDIPATGPYIPLDMNSDSLFQIPGLIETIVWARFCYVDECGNGGEYNDFDEDDPNVIRPAQFTNCCFYEIRVKPDQAPSAICEGFTKVQLSGGENTLVPAETFDDHSFDLCGDPVSFRAKRIGSSCVRSDLSFGSNVNFCCSDLGNEITVELEVEDVDGNISTCRGKVNVMNMGPTKVGCPQASVSLECDEDYRDHDIIGYATSDRSCENSTRIGFDHFNLNEFNVSCNIGEIYRKILDVDANGDTLELCRQHISVLGTELTTLLRDGDYKFPDNEMIDICGNESTHPDHTGYPSTDKDFKCIDIGISYEDSNPISSYNNGLCYTILRTWTVVDWCRYDPDYPNAHSIKGTQEIMVKNTGMPVFNCPDTLMVSVDSLECRAHVDINAVISHACASGSEVIFAIDLHSDGTIDHRGSGTDASEVYPVGTHTITFKAKNECGGPESECSFVVIVKGDRPPLPICLSSITWTLNEQGIAVVWASDFDQKSEGGCDGEDTLSFSFVSPLDPTYPQPSMSFNCMDDVPNGVSNSIILNVFIIDESGNYESCSVVLVLQDTNDVCPDLSPRTSLGGQVMTEALDPLQDVEVRLENVGDGSEVMNMTTTSGNYAFDNVDYYSQYMLAPQHDVDHLNGISTLDIVKIQRHILGLETLDSPYKLIAADINADENINGIDLVELRKLILGLYQELPQNDAWVFVSERYQFPDPTQPWGYDNSIAYSELYASDMDADFYGVKVGDVNNSITTNFQQDVTSRNSSLYVKGPKESWSAGELAKFPLILDEDADVLGLQMTIEFDIEAMVFQGIDGAELRIDESNFALLNSPKGKITISYSNADGLPLNKEDVLFNVYFEMKKDAQSNEVFDVNSSLLDSEIYVSGSQARPLEYVQSEFNDGAGSEVQLFQNKPNPFNNQTVIAFSVPTAQNISLKIFNAEGKLLWEKEKHFDAGIHDFRIDAQSISTDGMLIYRLESEETSITRRMVHLK